MTDYVSFANVHLQLFLGLNYFCYLPVDSESWERSFAISSQTRSSISSTSVTLSLDLYKQYFSNHSRSSKNFIAEVKTNLGYSNHVSCFAYNTISHRKNHLVIYNITTIKQKYTQKARKFPCSTAWYCRNINLTTQIACFTLVTIMNYICYSGAWKSIGV